MELYWNKITITMHGMYQQAPPLQESDVENVWNIALSMLESRAEFV